MCAHGFSSSLDSGLVSIWSILGSISHIIATNSIDIFFSPLYEIRLSGNHLLWLSSRVKCLGGLIQTFFFLVLFLVDQSSRSIHPMEEYRYVISSTWQYVKHVNWGKPFYWYIDLFEGTKPECLSISWQLIDTPMICDCKSPSHLLWVVEEQCCHSGQSKSSLHPPSPRTACPVWAAALQPTAATRFAWWPRRDPASRKWWMRNRPGSQK